MSVVLIIEYILMWFLGASLASFYGVVAIRVPLGQSIIKPSSHCDSCGTNLGGVELIPVLGYVLYRGKCKHCGAKVPLFFPLVEFFFGVYTVALYIKYGVNFYENGGYFESLLVVSLLLITAMSDMFHRKIMNIIVLLLLFVALYVNYTTDIKELYWRLLESVIVIGSLLALRKLKNDGLGLGDVKLYAVLILLLGASNICIVVFAASLLAIICTLSNKNARANKREYRIPFGFYTSLVVILFYIEKLFH